MKSSIFLGLISSVAVLATNVPEWHAPRTGELRSPCPGLNVLANHGILPRNGRNLDRDMVLGNLAKWYNVSEAIALNLFTRALNETGRPDATTFDLVDIRLHNVPTIEAIEQDASFSRADYYWGDDYSLNQTVWQQTRSFWKGDLIDAKKFGNAARARHLDSQATNPWFYYPQIQNVGAAMAFMAGVLGGAETDTVPTAFVDEWIVKERLPAHLGWSTSKTSVTPATVGALAAKIFVASGLNETGTMNSRLGGPIHAGFHL